MTTFPGGCSSPGELLQASHAGRRRTPFWESHCVSHSEPGHPVTEILIGTESSSWDTSSSTPSWIPLADAVPGVVSHTGLALSASQLTPASQRGWHPGPRPPRNTHVPGLGPRSRSPGCPLLSELSTRRGCSGPMGKREQSIRARSLCPRPQDRVLVRSVPSAPSFSCWSPSHKATGSPIWGATCGRGLRSGKEVDTEKHTHTTRSTHIRLAHTPHTLHPPHTHHTLHTPHTPHIYASYTPHILHTPHTHITRSTHIRLTPHTPHTRFTHHTRHTHHTLCMHTPHTIHASHIPHILHTLTPHMLHTRTPHTLHTCQTHTTCTSHLPQPSPIPHAS